ncbi:hypothetical protein U1Q18_041252 [Sarracenia purpurea var. burkii]
MKRNRLPRNRKGGQGVIPPPIRPDERSTELHPYSPGPCTSLSPGGWPPILDLPIFKKIPGSIRFSIKGGPPSPPFRPILDRDFTDAEANVQSGAARCLADPLLPIRVGLTQKYMVRTSSFHVEDTGSIPVRDRYSFPAAFSQCSLLSDRSLSGWKRWSGSFLSPSKQDEITTSLSNGLP